MVETVGQCDGPGTQARVRTTKFVQNDGCSWSRESPMPMHSAMKTWRACW